ncbi:MAG: hypothetical protein L0211_09430 [Planctomycetaceae bacterium]|nr:hypothetical protein [Planctomycetaceae bacterium]
MDTHAKCDGSATVDFAGSETMSIQVELARPEGFAEGATWAFKKMAAWLETTTIAADDEVAQRAVDDTRLLIAEQARLAAVNLQFHK